jgi:DNA-binding MarR family transcriptional regulator
MYEDASVAVTTYTRRHVVDMLPEYLTKRSGGFGPVREGLAKDAGLTVDVLMGVGSGIVFAEGDVVLRERYIWRSPYAIKRSTDAGWATAVAAGVAEPIPGGWHLKPRALELAEKVQRGMRDHLRGIPLPADAVRRAADALEPIADRIPASAKRAALMHRLRPKADEPKADILRLNRSAAELWYFRDDCHIGAWESQGYEGPVFDVLSFMWPGRPDMAFTKLPGATSLDALAEALKARQDRPDVERAVATLEKRGDVARDGDSVRLTPKGQKARDEIEDETDRRFFAIWQLDDAATARLGEDLRAVIDAFPKPG